MAHVIRPTDPDPTATSRMRPNIADFLLARIAEDEASVAAIRRPPMWQSRISTLDGDLSQFIARQHPDRVRAEVNAKVRIVALHDEVVGSTAYYGDDIDTPNGTPACGECGEWSEYAVRWPCPTLRALATIYSEHPDFREEWRP